MRSESAEPGRTTSAEAIVVTVGRAEASVVSAVSPQRPENAALVGDSATDSRNG